MILPDTTSVDTEQLYIRGTNFCIASNNVMLTSKGTISFLTYFNSFASRVYAENSNVDTVQLNITAKGKLNFKLFFEDQHQKNLLGELDFSSADKKTVSFEFSVKAGVYYFDAESSCDSIIYDFEYVSVQKAINDCKIGIVICTFKRENFVLANTRAISEYIALNPELDGKIKTIVVDNGNTLGNIDNALVVANKNSGGSGGFKRGIEEVLADDNLTHFLLMDDDISFYPDIIARTLSLINHCPDSRNVTIGASMMTLDKPYEQYERGGIWTGAKIEAGKAKIDLRDSKNVILNETVDKVDYTAWWFCCMDKAKAKEIGLPLPFFVKCDDIEYALRADNKILLTNGIGVWHESFDSKYVLQLEYYIKRNELILNAIHNHSSSFAKDYFKILKSVALQLVFHRYQGIHFIEQGVLDYLKGADYFANLDGERQHKWLSGSAVNQFSKQELIARGYDISKKEYFCGKRNFLLEFLTLNGYLIPKCFYPKCDFRLVDASKTMPENMFLAKTCVQYNSTIDKGFVTELQKWQLFRALKVLAKLFFLMATKRKKLKRDYQQLINNNLVQK